MLYIYRYDWHQTGTQVVIAFYAKACVPGQCLFEANQTSVSHLTSPSSLSYIPLSFSPSPFTFSETSGFRYNQCSRHLWACPPSLQIRMIYLQAGSRWLHVFLPPFPHSARFCHSLTHCLSYFSVVFSCLSTTAKSNSSHHYSSTGYNIIL